MLHYILVGVLVIAATFGLSQILTTENLLPTQASEQAVFIDKLFNTHFLLIAFFYSLIVVFILYSAVAFRRRKGEEGEGEHFEGNTKLEIAWTVIPLVIVLGLAFMGADTLADVERRDPEAREINVIASQWSWRFEYPDEGIVTDELGLIFGQQVVLNLQSEDVIHSFWVPEFRVKQDVLPGGEAFERQLRITPNEPGSFQIRCAELCGTQHSTMLANVEVMTTANFNQWVVDQSVCETPAECGQQVVRVQGCAACHSVDGTTIVGPTWQGLFGSQVLLADGTTVLADADYIRKSITEPNAQIHEGFNSGQMPENYGEKLSDEEIDNIIAFIESLQ